MVAFSWQIECPSGLPLPTAESHRGSNGCFSRMFNSAWKRARAEAGLEQVRVHDLKHTCGHRLRAVGVPL